MLAECHTPGCTNTGGHGYHLRCWCRAHADELARIRADFEADEPTAITVLGRTIRPAA